MIFLILWLIGFIGVAHAADYPQRTVRMVIPLAVGGGSDIVGRIAAQRLSEHWKQNIVVDNRPGAGGTLGTGIVERAVPDGYTILLTSSTISINAAVNNVPINLVPVSLVASQPSVIIVANTLSVKTLADLIELLRSNPDRYNYGSAGINTASHFANELFLRTVKATATHVPYTSAGIAASGLIKAEIHFMVTNIATSVPLIQSGRVQALAITSRVRSPALANVPPVTNREQEYSTWYGIFVPRSAPRSVVDKINRDVVQAVTQQILDPHGLTAHDRTPAQFDTLITSEVDRFRKIASTGESR